MTCIAGAVINGELCIGGDAVSVSRDANVRIGIAGKVFRLDEFLIGGSGTVRAGQLMRYVLQPPPLPPAEDDLMPYMVTEFASAVRTLMKEGGTEFTTSSNTVEMDGRYLVGVRGRLFSIDGGYGVFESLAPYAAVGCADQEALAAMYTAYSLLKDPLAEDIVNRGLLAAAELDTSIRPPFTIMTLPADVSRETVISSNGHRAKLAKV
jgi:hypothetical protein